MILLLNNTIQDKDKDDMQAKQGHVGRCQGMRMCHEVEVQAWEEKNWQE